MKRVLLLSCGTGQGHHSCARAIQEYFEARGVSCEQLDPLGFISEKFAGFMSWGHSFMYRYVPGLFRWGYRYSEEHPEALQVDSDAYQLMASGADGLYQHISDGGFDTVVCTHTFAAMMLTQCLKDHLMPVTSAFVATDYTCYPGLEACRLDYYFIPDDKLAGHFIRCGVPPARVIASGIPVRQAFLTHADKRAAKGRLGIAPERRHLVTAGGSMGAGPMAKLLKAVSARLGGDMEVSVLCGTNEDLRAALKWQYGQRETIHITGYTNQIPLYLDAADLYLTKPGGISVTEAAAKGTPMAFVNAVAGCELYNMDYFVEMGAAVSAPTPEELAEKSVALLRSPAELYRMENALSQYRQPNGAELIFQKLSKDGCDEQHGNDRLPPIQAQQTEYAGV